jgi:hypothetical protein
MMMGCKSMFLGYFLRIRHNRLPRPSVKSDLRQSRRLTACGQGVDFQQIKEQVKARIGHESALPAAQPRQVLDLPAEGEHVLADQPDDIGGERFFHAEPCQQCSSQLGATLVVTEGANAAVDFTGRIRLANVVQQHPPGQPPVGVRRQQTDRQEGMDQSVPFRVVVGGLGDIGQAVELGQESTQTEVVPKSGKALLRVGTKQGGFYVEKVIHEKGVVIPVRA